MKRREARSWRAPARIKPTDAVIVGMYQQFGDQVGEDAALVREFGADAVY